MSFDHIKIGECQHIAQSIAKLLQCSICLEVFSDPVSVGCAHFFCRNCIGAVLRTQTETVCPICKKSFTRRHVQEAYQRQKIVAATKELVSAIENIAGNIDSSKKKLESPPSRAPTILLSSDSLNHSSARNIKKANFVAHKNLESVEIISEKNQGMIYFMSKGTNAAEQVQTPRMPIEKDGENFKTKFYDKSESTSRGIAKESVDACLKGKLIQNKESVQSQNSVSTDDCVVKRKSHISEKKKRATDQKENKIESVEHDIYEFEKDDNSVYNNGEMCESSHGKKAKRNHQQVLPVQQNLKRYIYSPMLSKKKRKIVRNVVEVNDTATKNMTNSKKKRNSNDLLSDGKKKGESLMEENNPNTIQKIPEKCVDEMETNDVSEGICDLKLMENEYKMNQRETKGTKDEPLKENIDFSIRVENDLVLEALPSCEKNISLNLEDGTNIQNLKSIGSLLSRTASLKSCQKLISNKKKLLKHNNFKVDEVINDSRDDKHLGVTKSCNEDYTSIETVVVLPVTSPEDQADDDRDYMSRSPGWSRINQMNKDFHLRKFSLLRVQKNKNLHSPNVSICVGPNENQDLKEQDFNVSEEPIPFENAKRTEKQENILPLQDKIIASETDNVTSDIQQEEPLSDPVSHRNTLKKLNFDHQKITNDNEVSMDFGNTAPFDINDMDVDAVFANKDDAIVGREILAENAPVSPAITNHSSLSVPEESGFEFTAIKEFHNSSEVESMCKLKNDMQQDKLSCNLVLDSLEKAVTSSDSGLKIQKHEKSAELLFTSEHSRKCNDNFVLKELLLRDENRKSETVSASNNTIDKQQCLLLSTVGSRKETVNDERKHSSSIPNVFAKHKLNSFVLEKSFEGCKNEKVVKRVCLTLDEICAYFNDNNTSGVPQNIATVPLPFTNYKLQLIVAEETLNISILKVLQNPSCENFNTSSNSSFHDLKADLPNTTVKKSKDAQTQFETHSIDAQTQCQMHNVDVEIQCRTDSVDAQVQCSSLIVSEVFEEDSQMDFSMETLPETQPWTASKKEEDKDDCEDWLNESIVTDPNTEVPILPEQTIKKTSVSEAKTANHEESYLMKFEKDSQVDTEKIANETLYISSSSIPSYHSMDIKSIEHKFSLEIDICKEKNSVTAVHSSKKSTNHSVVNDDDCYPHEGVEIHTCSTPIKENDSEPESHSETNNSKMNPISINQIKEIGKPDVNFTSSEAIFEPTKFSNSKNTYSKANSSRKRDIELLKKEKWDKFTFKENVGPSGRLSPVESCHLSENFDPFAESIDFCKKSPTEAEFDEILKESENYSSDPDMIFATNLVAPLKDIARKEREISLLTKSKHPSTKCVNPGKGLDTDALKSSQKGSKQFKRISAYSGSDSSESEELLQTRSHLKRKKRIKEKMFIDNVIKALDGDDADFDASPNLNNPQAIARIYANVNADLKCGQASPKPLDKPSKKEFGDVKCIFEAPLSCDDEPSETASKLELELNEMQQEAEKLRKEIFQEESMEKMNEDYDIENGYMGAQKSKVGYMSCDNEDQCDLSISKESNDVFTEQIPPTPPNFEVIEKSTKFSSKIYKRN